MEDLRQQRVSNMARAIASKEGLTLNVIGDESILETIEAVILAQKEKECRFPFYIEEVKGVAKDGFKFKFLTRRQNNE